MPPAVSLPHRLLLLAGALLAFALALALPAIAPASDPPQAPPPQLAEPEEPAPEAADALAGSYEDWRITTPEPYGADVRPGTRIYRLHNRTMGRPAVYGERTFGINLVWGSSSGTPTIRFERRSGTGPLRYGEPIAIHVGGGGYLRYQNRTFGINLGWSDRPVYEWRLRGGEGIVDADETLALHNAVEDDVLVYAPRDFGINLRWYRDTLADDDGVTTANANLGLRVGPFPYSGTCSGRVVWTLTPVSLTGSDGIDTPVTVDRPYSGQMVSAGPNEYYCQTGSVKGNLRPGTWRVHAATALWNTTCDVTLSAGLNLLKPVHFRQYRSGCVHGITWP